MNFRNMLRLSTIVLFLTVVLGSSIFGQTKYYVDVQFGLDGYNGLSPAAGGPGVGPKQTINNAITAASSGDTISVAYANGNLYNENVVVGDKKLVFTSTGGAPVVVSLTINNTVASPNDITTFTGPFEITTALTLTDGRVIGASNLTVGGTVTRNVVNATAFGSVDSQLKYTGVVDFSYIGGAAVTAGYELPPASNTTNFGNLTTAAGSVLTLNESKTMNGIITTAAELKLGGNTLTVVGNSVAHANGAAITGGTLTFDMDGATTITGAFALPNVIAYTDATARTLTIASATAVGDITANDKAVVTVTAATAVGNVTNNGDQTVTLTAATTSKTLNNTSSGIIDVNTAAGLAVTGSVLNSGIGSVDLIGVGAAVTVSSTVVNNPTITFAAATADKNAASNYGVIIFPNQTVTITGKVTNSAVITGTNGATNSTHANVGEIRFSNVLTDVTLTGGVEISSSHSLTKGTGTLSVTNSGGVIFSNTSGDILIPGGITVSSSWAAVTGATVTGNGSLNAVARIAAGQFGTLASRVGAIVNSSTAANGANGNINIVSAANVGFFGTSVTSTGAAGGYINFANENLNLSGSVTNQRTVAGTHINFGSAATNGVTVQIAGNVSNEGKSDITFMAFQGDAATTFAVTGKIVSSGTGTIGINPLSTLAGTGSISLGGIDLKSGTVDLEGNPASAVMDVVINGNADFIGGTFKMATASAPFATLTILTALSTTPVDFATDAATDRVLQLGGLTNTFSSAAGTTNFNSSAGMANVILLIQPTNVVAAQTITGNATTTVWPGIMVVKNPTGLMPAVTFTGGNIRVLRDLTFDLSQVKLDGMKLFVGGLLAPNIGSGDFYNHPGYATANNGFVSMNGNAAAAVGGAGTFQNFEVDMAAGAAVAGNFVSTFNLTNGAVTGGAAIVFNNSDPYPTIVRNAGTFAVAPTFTSMVNVYYIGLDKATANELPAAADKLNNLTVATTNDGTAPLIAGKGAVTVAVATTVNGILEVFDNQALVISGVDVTVKGATIKLNNSGIISNVAAADELVFGSATGTEVTGTGWLPDVRVAVGSANNKINGVKGLVTNYLGTDDSFGGAAGAADFVSTAAVASGSITFGAGVGELEVVFGTGALNGTNLAGVTTAHASNVLQFSSNVTSSGDIAHVAGAINIGEGFTWTYLGSAPVITGDALTNGPGKLVFKGTSPTTLSAVGTDVTIAAPVDVDFANAADLFVIDPTNAGHLILAGDVNIKKGTVQLGDNVTAGRDLTLTGKNFTMSADASFIAHDGLGAFVLGTLILEPATDNVPMIWTYAGNPTLGNVTIANDVELAGTGASLTIYRTFTHSGGKLNFGAKNITIDAVTTPIDGGALAAAGTFNRTAAGATYQATDGFLSIRTTTFNQGTDFSIPNLRFGGVAGGAPVQDAINVTFGTASGATVTKKLYLDIAAANTITHTVGGSARLTVADKAVVYYSDGKFDVAPAYTTIDLTLVNPAAVTVNATVWPATATLVKTLVVNNAAAATLPDSRTVNTAITYTAGTLNVPTTKTLTVANNASIKVDAGVLTLTGTGAVSYGTGTNVTYIPSAAAYVSNGNEIPATVNNLKFTRESNTVNRNTTLNKAVTVNGTLTIKNDLTTAAAAPITLNGNLIIGLDAYDLATIPVTTFGAALTFGGSLPSAITVPEGGAQLGDIRIAKGANNATVNLVGGDLTTGTIYFEKGLFITGDNTLNIPAPALPVGGQGFNRDGVVAGNVSHVVGNVAKTLTMMGAINNSSESRSEFPVGSRNLYKPVSVTFNPVFGIPTIPHGYTIIATHVDEAPDGAVALPIADGVAEGIDVARYPNFYWFIRTKPTNLSSSVQFDLELTSPGFFDFDDINNVRIIRRHGTETDITNQWLLQGTNDSYDNEVSSGVPTVVQRGANAGLRAGGAIFTLGVSSNMTVANPIADQHLILENGAKEYDLSSVFAGNVGELTFKAQSANVAVATVAVSGSTLTITPVKTGDAVVTVVAMDEENNDFFSYSFNVNVSPLVGVDEETVPTDFALYQNFPNPFNPSTNIKFDLPKESNVAVRIYNILGEEVATLVNRVMQAGRHTVEFNASRLSSGMYIYRIEAGDFVQVKKMLLMK